MIIVYHSVSNDHSVSLWLLNAHVIYAFLQTAVFHCCFPIMYACSLTALLVCFISLFCSQCILSNVPNSIIIIIINKLSGDDL